MRSLRGAEDLHSSFVVDNHAETQLLSGKAGQFWQSLDDISFLGKDKRLWDISISRPSIVKSYDLLP